jgi:hypothetical protein
LETALVARPEISNGRLHRRVDSSVAEGLVDTQADRAAIEDEEASEVGVIGPEGEEVVQEGGVTIEEAAAAAVVVVDSGVLGRWGNYFFFLLNTKWCSRELQSIFSVLMYIH